VFWSLCVGCAVAVLKIFEGLEILKNNFSWVGEVEALLHPDSYRDGLQEGF
jgi:hypothetical protein